MIDQNLKEFYRKQVQNQHEKFVVKFQDEVQVARTPPSRYYVIDAFGHYIFVKIRERAKAQAIIDEVYGKGFYKIRFMGLEPIGREVNAR
ncbi:MAG: hypothetical protein GOVbin1096_93 [Prokaryotic dsDNA virus sp.]|jgi:hypothetical protein|nr:MAG: hypothetical protein GOVbin1096_93 [Prokaryotic dsDNA virus sp.]|tara:strand:+ start:18801 stop:19070 length:270 start_codon:yes stop_codon:yes gene_type:complete